MSEKRKSGERRRLAKMSPLSVGMLMMQAHVSSISAAEIFLPRQEITMSGRVLEPSCKAAFDKGMLNFTLDGGKGAKMPESQTLTLQLSDCDLTGLGVKLDAPAWRGFPERGMLKGRQSGQGSEHLYYTIGINVDKQNVFYPLSFSTDSSEWVKHGDGGYFHLNQEMYWLEVNGSLNNREVMNIPFTVAIRQTEESEVKGGTEDTEFNANFTLSLSYR